MLKLLNLVPFGSEPHFDSDPFIKPLYFFEYFSWEFAAHLGAPFFI